MATLPAYVKILREGYAERRESALLRTEMESGPPRQAKVKSLVMVQRPVQLQIDTGANYALFITWYGTTINEGADWFDYTDPVSAGTLSARFVGGGFSAVPLGAASGPWRISATIETWG